LSRPRKNYSPEARQHRCTEEALVTDYITRS
jgi:hypothetical protein